MAIAVAAANDSRQKGRSRGPLRQREYVGEKLTAEAEIRRRIQQHGAITVAEFMELALYWPDGGYYTSAQPFGASGDYYTSPMAHPAFGALLAVQLFQMWRIMGCPKPFYVVEMGAGDGLLCRDIVAYSVNLPEDFSESLNYVCLDRCAGSGEHAKLSGASQVTAAGLPLRGVTGCFISNEFLDAFPVHQVKVDQGRLREVYVSFGGDGENLVETLREPSTPALAQRLNDLGVELAEGQTAEINLGLDRWAREVAAALDSGFVLTIDYGHPADELYSPKIRPRGTLTTYYRHIQNDAPFRHVGAQDITAKVDFTSVVEAGRSAGLLPVGLTAQGEFLNNLGFGRFREKLRSLALSPANLRANRAMMDLINPTGLGDFKVLVQCKNVNRSKLWGLEPSSGPATLIDQLPFPLLTRQHIDLVEGRYPQGEYEVAFQELWPWEGAAP